jgi:hypothetical protein
MESYINERTGSEFSHSVCPDCVVRVVQPQLDKMRAELKMLRERAGDSGAGGGAGRDEGGELRDERPPHY